MMAAHDQQVMEEVKARLKPPTETEYNEVTARWLFGKNAEKMLGVRALQFRAHEADVEEGGGAMGEVSAAITALDVAKTRALVEADLAAGRDPMELIEEARLGLQAVGEKFDAGEYFLIELGARGTGLPGGRAAHQSEAS